MITWENKNWCSIFASHIGFLFLPFIYWHKISSFIFNPLTFQFVTLSKKTLHMNPVHLLSSLQSSLYSSFSLTFASFNPLHPSGISCIACSEMIWWGMYSCLNLCWRGGYVPRNLKDIFNLIVLNPIYFSYTEICTIQRLIKIISIYCSKIYMMYRRFILTVDLCKLNIYFFFYLLNQELIKVKKKYELFISGAKQRNCRESSGKVCIPFMKGDINYTDS